MVNPCGNIQQKAYPSLTEINDSFPFDYTASRILLHKQYLFIQTHKKYSATVHWHASCDLQGTLSCFTECVYIGMEPGKPTV